MKLYLVQSDRMIFVYEFMKIRFTSVAMLKIIY